MSGAQGGGSWVTGSAVAALCGTILALGVAAAPASAQYTRAERSNYTETSSHADVLAFLDELARAAPGTFHRGLLAYSSEGRELPYVVASRPLFTSPQRARESGRPIVYLQGNIHGGEVEGKEAVQALLRDLVTDPKPNVLDSLVLVIVPIYNADGNDAWGPSERQRGSQNGPPRIGQRPNGQELDLNRDYIKVEAPETQASMRMFAAWDPDVFVDLHTTNGSYHGYALTYAPSLHPAAMVGALAPAGPFTRDTLLPELRRLARARGVETFDYGNFTGPNGQRDDPTSYQKGGWLTYEHVPRFGTNYHGLHNRVSILSEAYSHDPFARRVEATRIFLDELLSLSARRASQILARTRRTPEYRPGMAVPVRAELTTRPFTAPVLVEALAATGDTVRTEPGLRPGFRRTFEYRAVEMPVYDRFDATRTRPLPVAWAVPVNADSALARLAWHGIPLRSFHGELTVDGEAFVVDSLVKAPRPFQGHQNVRLEGRWVPRRVNLGGGSYYVVEASGPHALLAAILLEPESDDGLTTWNFFDDALSVGGTHPVVRIVGPLPVRAR